MDTFFESSTEISFNTVEVQDTTCKQIYECGICFKQLSSHSSIRRHIQLKHEPKPEAPKVMYEYACQICSKTFPTISNVNRHMLTHTGDKPYACEHCEKKFTQSTHYKRHLVSVHGTGGGQHFICTHSGCEKRFAYENDLKYHVSQAHGTEKFSCPYCGKLFNTEYNVRRHMVIHQKLQSKQPEEVRVDFQCENCVWRFKTDAALKKHIKWHEKFGDPTYNCNACNLPYFTTNGLLMHLRTVHDTESPSGSTQTDPMLLGSEETGSLNLIPDSAPVIPVELPHQCSGCTRKFRYRHHLKIHEKKKHADPDSGDNSPVMCRKCGRVYETKMVLMRHMMSDHTLGYLCRICGDRFRKMFTYVRHMKYVHAQSEEMNV